MLIRGVGSLLLLTLVIAVAGCDATPVPAPAGAAAAVPSYEPPPQAPAFCTRLARSTYLPQLPTAVGRLTVDPADPAAAWDLRGAITDLQEVAAVAPRNEAHDDLVATLEDLLAAVQTAAAEPGDDGLGRRLSLRLAEFGDAVQPLCEFPA